MFLEGCRWSYEHHNLTDSQPKELFSDLPLMELIPMKERESATQGIYYCPLYLTILKF
jgi:dynein heavy chain